MHLCVEPRTWSAATEFARASLMAQFDRTLPSCSPLCAFLAKQSAKPAMM